jgi:hypothetical protein
MASMNAKTHLALLFCLILSATPARAASEDIHFIAEHLPEAGQDARYTSLPFLADRMEAGKWQQTFQVGYAQADANFLRIGGPMVAFNAGRGLSDRWGFSVLGFYDSMKVSGDTGRQVLRPFFFPNVPLDLPQNAEFSNPRGDYRHWGIGGAFIRELSPAGADRRWTLTGGLLYDHLEIKNYQMDYRILAGRNAGVTGVLDHSSDVNFVTPYLGAQYTRPLGSSWSLAPRIVGGAPLPPGDFDARLTGPGFDLSTARGQGSPGKIGDAFVGASAGLIHLRSGLEIDLGTTLFFPILEKASHPGVSKSLMVQVAWHR